MRSGRRWLLALAAALLSACSGAPGTTPADGAGDAPTADAAAVDAAPADGGVQVVLGNLPATETTSREAAISHELVPALAGWSVWCRRDAYDPIACPQPFVLGHSAGGPLPLGRHTVDFWAVDVAHPLAPSTPTTSYSWEIVAGPLVPLALLDANAGAGIEAPADSDATDYATKTATNGSATPPLANLLTVSRGGNPRFRPVTVDGVPAIEHTVVSSDPLRNGSHTSLLSHHGFTFANGEDVWLAAAYKLDPTWTYADSGSSPDRVALQVVNSSSQSDPASPFTLVWVGGGAALGLNWVVADRANTLGDLCLYKTAITPGQWIRVITHYRSGQTEHAPIMEAWVAHGAGEYVKLTPLSGLSPHQTFGEPLSTPGSGNDWPKIGISKFTPTSYGSIPTRRLWSSGLYAGRSTSQLAACMAALARYALD